MSKHMLSDSNTINDFNPYVMGDFSLPGASRKPQAFDRHPLPAQKREPVVDEKSPLCEYGITAGDRTVDMCRPPKPNCSLSRPLLPGRNIDRGFTVARVVEEAKKSVEKTVEQTSVQVWFIIFLILLIAVL